ncbi:MAG: hypothetical protein K0R28_7080 [Paenibacillus sp.]|nr:hypothetical protein [Paenibacillus sp.]
MNNATHPSGVDGTRSAETAASEQTDYVRLLKDHNEIPDTLYAKVTGDRFAEVLVPFKGNRCAHYGFGKNRNDDFILFRNGAVSDLEPVAHTEITDWTPDEAFRAIQSIRIEQRMLGIHPDDPSSPVAEIDCSHTVDRNGVHVRSAIKWLRPVSISAGYGMMFPVAGSFVDKLATGLGHLYEATATDRSKTNLLEDDRSASYAFVHTPEGPDGQHETIAAMNVHDIAATFRYGQEGRRRNNSVVWIEHRNEAIQKLYPQVYDNYTVHPGETYEASGTYFIGELPAAKQWWR